MIIKGIITALLILLFAFCWQTSLDGINRKIIGRFQKRYGPKWYQQFRDIFKLLSKTGISHGWVYDFGVMMALGGIMATVMFLPVGKYSAFPGFDNFFIFVYLFAVGMLGMAMSSVGSGNPLASIGVMRALTQMVGYEVPFMIVILAIIYGHDTSSLSELAQIQQSGGIATWNIVRMPIGGIVAYISLLGMLGKKPFETYIAPAEIASGPMVEYGGKQLGMLMIMYEFSMFIPTTLFVTIFLGGGATIPEFLAKYFVVFILASLISNALGRFKIDQVIKFYYKVPLALAILQALLVIFLGWGV
jgi:NADH-quinone oxidoreductase subunit H